MPYQTTVALTGLAYFAAAITAACCFGSALRSRRGRTRIVWSGLAVVSASLALLAWRYLQQLV